VRNQPIQPIKKGGENHDKDSKDHQHKGPGGEGLRLYKRTDQPTGDLAQLGGGQGCAEVTQRWYQKPVGVQDGWYTLGRHQRRY